MATGLHAVIEEQGRTRKWIAQQIGVTRQQIHKWEYERSPIPPARLPELAALLSVDPSRLNGHEEG